MEILRSTNMTHTVMSYCKLQSTFSIQMFTQFSIKRSVSSLQDIEGKDVKTSKDHQPQFFSKTIKAHQPAIQMRKSKCMAE